MQKVRKEDARRTVIYTAVFFVLTGLFCIAKDFTMKSNSQLYSLFLGDFSIGYCSRFIIGEIISWFKPTLTREWLSAFLRIVTFAVFAVVAHYTASTVTKTSQKNRTVVFLFAGIFLINPFSFTIHAGMIFEFLDIFCFAAMMMCIYFCESKYAIWLVPVCLIFGIFVHNAFLTAYLAPCLGFVIYFSITKYGKKKWTWLLFAVSVVLSFAAGIYTVAFANSTLKMTEPEVLEYLAYKGNCTTEELNGYIESYLFYTDVRDFTDVGHASNMWELIRYMFLYALSCIDADDIINLISVIPLIVLIFTVWIKAAKKADGFLSKVPYILFMLSVLPQILSILMSTDFERYLSTIVVSQLLFFFMCMRQSDENVQAGVDMLSANRQHFLLPVALSFFTNLMR